MVYEIINKNFVLSGGEFDKNGKMHKERIYVHDFLSQGVLTNAGIGRATLGFVSHDSEEFYKNVCDKHSGITKSFSNSVLIIPRNGDANKILPYDKALERLEKEFLVPFGQAEETDDSEAKKVRKIKKYKIKIYKK